jgi:hypothetical protein
MKNSPTHKYSDISSFDDFRSERERLKLKRQLICARLNSDYFGFSRIFSVSNLIFSFTREYLLPKIPDLIRILLNKTEHKAETKKNT